MTEITAEDARKILSVIPGNDPPPCDCCEQFGTNAAGAEMWSTDCQCGNPDDRAKAARWCEKTEWASKFETMLDANPNIRNILRMTSMGE